MIDDIPAAILEDAAQLVKANSIQGNKMNNIDVVYTMWSNLKKTPGMEVGQVGFHKDKEVYFMFLWIFSGNHQVMFNNVMAGQKNPSGEENQWDCKPP